jgi:three-Cys-motif partner protein
MAGKRGDSGHRFGGDWTTRKLDVLANYLQGYTTALKKAPFEKWYVDAFAGTGYRDARRQDGAGAPSQNLLLPDLAETEPQDLLDGSARRAILAFPELLNIAEGTSAF